MKFEQRPAEQLSAAGLLREEVRATGLLAAPVLVLCSGGRDSICLLDVAVSLRGHEQVCALHVNYGLRGEASDADEALVQAVCRGLGVQLELVRAPTAPRSGNLQAWARDLRYGAASRIALERGMLVATGHTASDQVEGILYRLAASPGRRALLGMLPRDGILVRPLLAIERERTGAYCEQRGLRWREDSLNEDLSFARARVRARVLPELRALHAAAERNILATAELLRAEAEVLDEAVARALGGRLEIAVARLQALDPALARLIVAQLAERAAGRPVPGAASRTAELLELGARTQGSASLDLAGGVRAQVEYGVLRFELRSQQREAPAPAALEVPGTLCFGGWRLSCEVQQGDAAELLDVGPAVGVLDADTLAPGPLAVRAWRAGDRMRPIGMGGRTRALSDLFGAKRLPRAQRGSLPLLISGEEIAWVPGVASSERFRVGPQTRTALQLRAAREG